MNLQAFENNSLYIVHRIIKDRRLLLYNCLYKVYINNLYYKQLVVIYKDVTIDKEKSLYYLSNKEDYLYNINTYVKDNIVYIKVVFYIPQSLNMYINTMTKCGQYLLDTCIPNDIISYWKEFSHNILDYKKTQTARESSLGLFLFILLHNLINIISIFLIRSIPLFI